MSDIREEVEAALKADECMMMPGMDACLIHGYACADEPAWVDDRHAPVPAPVDEVEVMHAEWMDWFDDEEATGWDAPHDRWSDSTKVYVPKH